MNTGDAIAIFEQIGSDKYTPEEKHEAIGIVINMSTHMSITKPAILKVLGYQIGCMIEENTRLRGMWRWIPVSERLPSVYQTEEGEPLEFNVILPGATRATTLCYDGSQWFELNWAECKIIGYYTVTHWMPLPEPPEEGEGNG